MNPVLLAVIGIISTAIVGAASYILMPIEDQLHSEANYTGNVRAQEVADSQHDTFVIMPPVFVGGIFLSLFIQAVRRQSDEVYD